MTWMYDSDQSDCGRYHSTEILLYMVTFLKPYDETDHAILLKHLEFSLFFWQILVCFTHFGIPQESALGLNYSSMYTKPVAEISKNAITVIIIVMLLVYITLKPGGNWDDTSPSAVADISWLNSNMLKSNHSKAEFIFLIHTACEGNWDICISKKGWPYPWQHSQDG